MEKSESGIEKRPYLILHPKLMFSFPGVRGVPGNLGEQVSVCFCRSSSKRFCRSFRVRSVVRALILRASCNCPRWENGAIQQGERIHKLYAIGMGFFVLKIAENIWKSPLSTFFFWFLPVSFQDFLVALWTAATFASCRKMMKRSANCVWGLLPTYNNTTSSTKY